MKKIDQRLSWKFPYVSVDTVRVLDLAGDNGLVDGRGDGGHGVPLLEALANTKCGELLQQGCE